MEKVEGRVYASPLMPEAPPAERAPVYRHLVDVLAALHAVSPEAVGLGSFGRPGNYYERQISRWSKQYVASRTEDIPEMDALMEWLPRHIPAAAETVVVHGDYRLGNAIVHPVEPRIVAILDWELSTPRPPSRRSRLRLPDVLCGRRRPAWPEPANLHELGIPTEEEFVARYCGMAGLDGIENWHFYLVYNLFRAPRSFRGCTGADSTATRAPRPPSASRDTAACGRCGRGASPTRMASAPKR